MKHRIILSPGAKADFSSAVLWYQRTDPDVAFQFTQETLSILRRIEQFPYSFPLKIGPIRRAVLMRFPFYIYFSLKIEVVSVIAIVHQRRADILKLDAGNGHGTMRDP
jgi:plasmid stabilization system protein ParE